MYLARLMTACACLSITAPALAQEAADPAAPAASAPKPAKKAFTTGVAKGRDLLSTAISASSLDEDEIQTIGARTLDEALRNIPGIRVEVSGTDGNASYSIRGLPLASTGSKFLQFQEDGLPVLEFSDINQTGADLFLRTDLSLSQIQTIRGGSASTFASNSPGGVVNLISRTGETEGGAVQLTKSLGDSTTRLDFDYGAHLGADWRFNLGGFYRRGEGPRDTGFDAFRGGQIKANLTRKFAGGYVRFYAKYLDDKVPYYNVGPLMVTGSDGDPKYASVPGFDAMSGSIYSRYIDTLPTLDYQNERKLEDLHTGMHSTVKSFGLEASLDLGGWTVTERGRYAAQSASTLLFFPSLIGPASALAPMFAGPGASLSYATGPQAGQSITDPASLNGNGLMALETVVSIRARDLGNFTNDVRVSRVWPAGEGKLTTTAGWYHANQAYHADIMLTAAFGDVRGDGRATLLNLATATGVPLTDGGVFAYAVQPGSSAFRRSFDVDYTVDAPYASLNYALGKLALGASLRYDLGSAKGSIHGAENGLDGSGLAPIDMNGDGTISFPEMGVAVLPLSTPSPVDYDYHYLSYSLSVNYRLAQDFSLFARYSKGARAAADRLLFTPAVSYTTGKLTDPSAAYDPVKQAEIGAKFRTDNFEAYVTGFWAKTQELNNQVVADSSGQAELVLISRKYRAVGVEFESSYTRGLFGLTAGATYTSATIEGDAADPALKGNTPRHQPSLIFALTPKVTTELFTAGINVVGATSSYTQDVNQLKMPGYAIVNAFVELRPLPGVQLAVTAGNLFDKLVVTQVTQGALPTSGIVTAGTLNGRTLATALRFSF